ncbi:hypothetical protein EIP86_007591 [Pleurotus ostreatoroseus]|nr:hypothetical protein EIP86_007591 [Pleurotus ostreatoroseus]
MANLYDDSWRGTLTEDRLKRYLSNANGKIDSLGGPKNITPLAAACWQGHLAVVTLLLDNPHQLADPNAASPPGRTPLFYATKFSPKTNRAAIVHALLKASADPDARSDADGGNTPLMNAIAEVKDRDVVRELLAWRASTTVTNDRGESAETLAKGTPFEALVSGEEGLSSTLARIIDVIVSVVMLVVTYTNSYYIMDAVEAVANKLHETAGTKVPAPSAKDPSPIAVQAASDSFEKTGKGVDSQVHPGLEPAPSQMPIPTHAPVTHRPTIQTPAARTPTDKSPTAQKQPSQSHSQSQAPKAQPPTALAVLSQSTPTRDNRTNTPRPNTPKPQTVPIQPDITPGGQAPSVGQQGTHKVLPPAQIPAGQGTIAQKFGMAGIGQSVPVPEVFEEIAVPKTPAEFVKSMDTFVSESGLDKFFAPGDRFLQTLAEKAVALRNDPTTNLGSPENIKRLTRLSLYQTVIYCDDSLSMEDYGRYTNQTELVKRIARVATRIVPDGYGVELRFINSSSASNLDAAQVESAMIRVRPDGGTMLGSSLRDKILQPLVYNVIGDRNKRFERPLLVCVITDGDPSGEPPSTFKDQIVDCRRRLDRAGYEPTSVMFCVSQIGDDKKAKNFLDDLKNDPQIQDVLYCTAERLDDEFKEMRNNEKRLEEWLLKLLTSPIMGQDI